MIFVFLIPSQSKNKFLAVYKYVSVLVSASMRNIAKAETRTFSKDGLYCCWIFIREWLEIEVNFFFVFMLAKESKTSYQMVSTGGTTREARHREEWCLVLWDCSLGNLQPGYVNKIAEWSRIIWKKSDVSDFSLLVLMSFPLSNNMISTAQLFY